MRASRLLQMLLLLQNRGRMTARRLASELEVAQRTVMRDVDALSEAGLPIVVIRGNQGGIELGFNYRTRLTGLAEDEAEALAVLLGGPRNMLEDLGMRAAGERAAAKLIESLPDRVRQSVSLARSRFGCAPDAAQERDERVSAMASAVRDGRIVTLRATAPDKQTIHPMKLVFGPDGWGVVDRRQEDAPVGLAAWGNINVSARRFSTDKPA